MHKTSINLLMIITAAMFFSLTIFNNITDYDNTIAFVQHTLSMDVTKQNPNFMWRAISAPTCHSIAFIGIIVWQLIVALLLWWSGAKLLLARGHSIKLQQAHSLALFAIALGFTLYALGFITLAGQWFMMREAASWNVLGPSHTFLTMLGLLFLILSSNQQK